jgi:ATP-dependent DNA helicase RecG
MAKVTPTPVVIDDDEAELLLSIEESHFSDVKSVDIAPAKLTRTISAFANAEGGEIHIGVDEDIRLKLRSWRGFDRIEDANAHIQVAEEMAPLGEDITCTFIQCSARSGLLLKIEVKKTTDIKRATDGQIYVRRSAQNLPIRSEEALTNLKLAKGLASFENEAASIEKEVIVKSAVAEEFIQKVVPKSTPVEWMRKQRVLIGDRPTVAGLILYADEPQAYLPKRTGVKVYRYKTNDPEGTRDTLAGDPASIEGHAYRLIAESVSATVRLIESVQVNTDRGLERVKYPSRALHEVITNAVLHRDYSIADDIHIRVFDNRVEVHSPGALPAHITPENIRRERFSRNPQLVRLINKFPNPPNKDIGEGLNTAFDEMRKMKLKEPQISQSGGYVSVFLRHEPLASPEEVIMGFLDSNETISNREARNLCFIGSENRMKGILQKMVKNGIIELVPGRTRYNAAYRKLVPDPKAPKQSELFEQTFLDR